MDLGSAGRTALVCAASKGLGRGCAQALAAEGVKLVIVARTRDTLEATADAIRASTGADVTAVCGKVEAILLTGGIAYGKYVTDGITARVGFISKVLAYPGEHELLALAQGALRVLRGEEEGKVYE